MLLTVYVDTGGKKAYIDADFDWGQITTQSPIKAEATVSAGYSDVSSPRNWLGLGGLVGYACNKLRNELMAFNASWGGLSTDNQKALVEQYVWPNGTPGAELDALYSSAQRNAFRDTVVEAINGDSTVLFSVWKDDTDGKLYRVTVDAGVTTKTEITTYGTL